jgi:hypothetical protein
MAAVGKQHYSGAFPTVLTTLVTVPAAKYIDIRQITVVNLDEEKDLTWWLNLGGVELVNGQRQWKVPAGENLDYEIWQALTAAQTVTGYCDGRANIFISGLEVDA